MVGLEPRRLVGRQGERRRVRLAEAERRERLEHLPDPVDVRPGRSRGRAPPAATTPRPRACPPGDPIARRTSSASARVTPVVSATISSTCSWKTTTPSVSSSAGMQRRVEVLGSLPALPGVEERGDHVGLHRAGPEQRDVDDEVARTSRARTCRPARAGPGSRSGSSRGCASCGSAGTSPRRRAARGPGRRGRSARRRPGATSSTACAIADCIRMPRTSSLSSPSASTSSLSNWLIGKPDPARLDRGAVQQRAVGQHHAARVQRDVAGQPVEPLDEVEQQVEPRVRPGRWPAARAARRWRCGRRGRRMCGNALAIASTSPGGMPERRADVADRVPHPVGVHHRHAGDPLAAEPGQDLLVDLGAPGRLDVDVDVGQLGAQRRAEPLHQQAVRDRVDPGDAEQVVDQAARTRAAGGDPDAQVPDEVDDRRRR